MAKVQVQLTEETFIGGVLRPMGYITEIDLDDLGVSKLGEKASPAPEKKDEPSLTPNLEKHGKAGGDTIDYVVAPIAPTGPNPAAPQAVPAGTVQDGPSTFIAPAEKDGDSEAVRVVAETVTTDPAPAPVAKKARGTH